MNMSQCHIYHCIVANLVVYDRAEVVHNKTVHLPLFSECLGSSRGRGRKREKWGEKREKWGEKREKGKRERGKRKREEGKIEERDREEGGLGMHSSQSHRDQTEVCSFFQGSWNRN